MMSLEPRKVRVVFKVKRGGAGNGKVWWAVFRREDLRIFGEGSGRRVGIARTAQPHWLPRPQGEEVYISRRKGTRVDGEAWVDLEVGTILRCGAVCAGGWRHAEVRSPVLIVEDGASWTAEDYDGSRSVIVEINGARPLTVQEAEALLESVPTEAYLLEDNAEAETAR